MVGIFATISSAVGYLVFVIRAEITDSATPKGLIGYSLWILEYFLAIVTFISLNVWWFV